MNTRNIAGWTFIELVITIAIIGIIVASAINIALIFQYKSARIAQTDLENQVDAKTILFKIANELENCRDLLMPSDATLWPRDMPVYSKFLSFQKYRGDYFSQNYSTITYLLDGDTLYRYEHYKQSLLKTEVIDNLTPGTTVFFLNLGDVKTTRNVQISLTFDNPIRKSSSTFTTAVFVANPPAIGDTIYDLP